MNGSGERICGIEVIRWAVVEFMTVMLPDMEKDPDGFAILEAELYTDPDTAHEMVMHLLPLAERRAEKSPRTIEGAGGVTLPPGSVLHWISTHPQTQLHVPGTVVTGTVEVTRWALWVLALLAMENEQALEYWRRFIREATVEPGRLDRLATILFLFGWNIAHGHIPATVLEDLRAMGPQEADLQGSTGGSGQLLH